MTSSAPGRFSPYTYREYALLPQDGQRYEIMQGDLFVSPAPSPGHQRISAWLQYALMKALAEPGLAEVFAAPTDLILNDNTVLQPDLMVVGADRAHVITKRGIEGTPNLVVEIVSQGSADRDNHHKKRIFERGGVPEYWVVDPDQCLVTAWRLDAHSHYLLRARCDRASILLWPDFPSLAIAMRDVFRA